MTGDLFVQDAKAEARRSPRTGRIPEGPDGRVFSSEWIQAALMRPARMLWSSKWLDWLAIRSTASSTLVFERSRADRLRLRWLAAAEAAREKR